MIIVLLFLCHQNHKFDLGLENRTNVRYNVSRKAGECFYVDLYLH